MKYEKQTENRVSVTTWPSQVRERLDKNTILQAPKKESQTLVLIEQKFLVLWKRVQNRRTKMLSVKLDRYDKKDVLLLMNFIRLSNRENLSY